MRRRNAAAPGIFEKQTDAAGIDTGHERSLLGDTLAREHETVQGTETVLG
jgi:hypothetical protein